MKEIFNYDLKVKKYHLDRIRDALADDTYALKLLADFVNNNNFKEGSFSRELYSYALTLSPNNDKLLSYIDMYDNKKAIPEIKLTIDNFNLDEKFMIDWCSEHNAKSEYLNIQIILVHNGIELKDFSIDFAIDLINKDGDSETLFSAQSFVQWEYVIELLNSNLRGLIHQTCFPNNILIEMSLKSFLNKIGL